MGVPGFFLWLWKKYKKSNFVLNLEEIKNEFETKWLCLDANCLLHPKCFEVLAENPNYTNKNNLENKMINRCLEYMDKLINEINPTEGIYLAIDGVAPIAKIKQQRSRRFKSISDRDLFDKIKTKHNKEITKFWSNSAITPGTEFMSKLTGAIYNWAKNQSRKIIFSSAQTPMEGEHKILKFIKERTLKNQSGNYVIYGLDADLIFLAMASQRNDIFLLREANQIKNTENKELLNLVDMEVMKECIIEEVKSHFEEIDCKLTEQEIINDFIFMGYFLGNDFLPHLVSLDIYSNGIPDLLKTYVESYQEKYQSLIKIEDKKVTFNQEMFKVFINKLASKEEEILADLPNKKVHKAPLSSDSYQREIQIIETLRFKIKDPIKLGEDNYSEYSKRYYQHYFSDDSPEMRLEVAYHFIKGMIWTANYYFEECPSWEYYYPYNFGPFLKDIANAIDLLDLNKIKFNKGNPLTPYQQLMTVLPQQTSYLLPNCFNNLMRDSKSKISHLYPLKFEQDFLHKHHYWQGIPLLPHFDLELIKQVYQENENKLTEDEKKRIKPLKEFIFN